MSLISDHKSIIVKREFSYFGFLQILEFFHVFYGKYPLSFYSHTLCSSQTELNRNLISALGSPGVGVEPKRIQTKTGFSPQVKNLGRLFVEN